MSNKIIFMGTPDFAVASLKELINNEFEVVAVITAPDRPAGRGQKLKASAVKEYALTENIDILQPEKLKDELFLSKVASYQADLFVVVAFRMLPEQVWTMPKLGTINLHGSLLPKYRGAAPINWAVINGDTETGATTFFIEKEIDTGKIIDNITIPINEYDTAGIVHDNMMIEGAKLLSRTVSNIFDGNISPKDQPDNKVSHAPKIFKQDCKIDWQENTLAIFNKIRGLSPYPTAFTHIIKDDSKKSIKLFKVKYVVDNKENQNKIKVEEKNIFFGTADGWIIIDELQIEGKKRMTSQQFLQGFNIEEWALYSL